MCREPVYPPPLCFGLSLKLCLLNFLVSLLPKPCFTEPLSEAEEEDLLHLLGLLETSLFGVMSAASGSFSWLPVII